MNAILAIKVIFYVCGYLKNHAPPKSTYSRCLKTKKPPIFTQMKFCFMWKMVLMGYMSDFKEDFILLRFHFIHLIAHLLVGMLILLLSY